MIISNIRGELRTAIELLEKKATAAEKVVYKELVFLHNGLTQVEGQIVVISLKAAKEYQKLLSAAKAEISELEAAIKHSETHADAVAKANSIEAKANAQHKKDLSYINSLQGKGGCALDGTPLDAGGVRKPRIQFFHKKPAAVSE